MALADREKATNAIKAFGKHPENICPICEGRLDSIPPVAIADILGISREWARKLLERNGRLTNLLRLGRFCPECGKRPRGTYRSCPRGRSGCTSAASIPLFGSKCPKAPCNAQPAPDPPGSSPHPQRCFPVRCGLDRNWDEQRKQSHQANKCSAESALP